MHLILATFLLFVLLRWVAARSLRSRHSARTEPQRVASPEMGGRLLWQSFKDEVLAWLIALVAVVAVLLVVYLLGGVPPIHEWRR